MLKVFIHVFFRFCGGCLLENNLNKLFGRENLRGVPGGGWVIKRFFESVLASKTVPPGFREEDVLGVILLLGRSDGPVGRYTVKRKLGLGEATAKTLLRRLHGLGIVRPAGRRGHVLTEEGKTIVDIVEGYIAEFKRVPRSDFSLGECDYGIRFRGLSHLVSTGLDQRDQAVAMGADGATTIIVREGRFLVPSVKELEGEEEEFIRRHFNLEEGDVVVIVSGRDCLSAFKAG